ncbi:MAG: DNA-directed RNA polymerase subunit alpha [Thermosynechococcus sp.]|uniref:DNA-directed RNA polymerase subunit alpha n=1 Tax=Thermosynechococcus sp. TaxID=2814275 RepID=UPI002206FC88|nr:DNA-directed RNA polymerase subunit alpha [Thermosynechococcus sp.]BCX11912.1 MAG: DNA-directed RNA polymerase subunit alpha [Thermosynechococcus sp.]
MAYQIECLETRVEEDQGQYGQFALHPLAPGQGITVGNALRRVLLANLPGSAVTAVRIAGVNHEFSTIPGVREDVMDILLQMKQLVIRSHTSEPQMGRLFAQAPADEPLTVTAGMVQLGSEVEVVNPNHYIATLMPGATLEMEFKIERDRGYRSVERVRDDRLALDYLQLDAVFMPVRRVNYTVDSVRSAGAEGDRQLQDYLKLEIWTNGSLTPQDALNQAATILVDLFSPLKEVPLHTSEATPSDEHDETGQIPIEQLNLSVRAYNCLKRAQVNTVADLLEYSQEELLEIKNFGQKSAEEVIEALQKHLGITLPPQKAARN